MWSVLYIGVGAVFFNGLFSYYYYLLSNVRKELDEGLLYQAQTYNSFRMLTSFFSSQKLILELDIFRGISFQHTIPLTV